jgi:hypothetical protein
MRDPISDSLDAYIRTKNQEQTVDIGYTNISRRKERTRMSALNNLMSVMQNNNMPHVKNLASRRRVRELLYKLKNSERFKEAINHNLSQNRPSVFKPS